ncbi:MAG: hypothetical protein A2855_00960 [Candidatus Liptonbacteria bacterium RIFCSPHIGHO2_01_FULL_57_28]|uniref:Addiction module toxin RelE n=1 Tax=Candidatus Liptonbacteria bacterium RIFCSPHIGHO2_01_FULL_57_28 TaxID=1798647 RepID=A0A1G2CBC7_9BACT|nr:MAG: hypothetical protein A2855_00960 [Candidatus Liptonbacteria bacterium RIFCSPHIGHO2_01_FULL_57_28]
MANLHLLDNVRNTLTDLPEDERIKVSKHIHLLESGVMEKVVIKTLKGKIKELIVQQYRLIFFRKNEMTYVVDIFKKQSQKTPVRIIDRAEKIYNLL